MRLRKQMTLNLRKTLPCLVHRGGQFEFQYNFPDIHKLYTGDKRGVRSHYTMGENLAHERREFMGQLFHHTFVAVLHIDINQAAIWRKIKQGTFLHLVTEHGFVIIFHNLLHHRRLHITGL